MTSGDNDKSLLHVAIGKDKIYEFVYFDSQRQALAERLANRKKTPSKDAQKPQAKKTFESVITDFRRSASSYKRASAIHHQLTPFIGSALLESHVIKKLEAAGEQQDNIENARYYTIPGMYAEQVFDGFDEFLEFMKFQSSLSELLIIGIISLYDGYISEILQLIFKYRPSLIEESQRTFSYRQILEFGSLDNAKDHILSKEIEAVLYEGRIEQIKWIMKKLDINLDTSDPLLRDFGEVCERRNALTHNGGRASPQYMEKCAKAKIDTTSIQIGEKLPIDRKYVQSAIDIAYEVGLRLGIIAWRKLLPDESIDAEETIQISGYSLIKQKRYKLAESVLEFATKMPQIRSDRTHKMNIVNLANAKRQLGKDGECETLLKSHDWSATSLDFQISVAATLKDTKKVVEIMERIGQSDQLPRDAYYDWPVFLNVKNDEEFKNAFHRIFGISLDEYNINMKAETLDKDP